MMFHSVRHSKMESIDDDKLFHTKAVIDELESNLNDNDETEASCVTREIQEDPFINTERNKREIIAS